MNKDKFKLLYNQLWKVDPSKAQQLNPHYVELKLNQYHKATPSTVALSNEKMANVSAISPDLPDTPVTVTSELILNWDVLVNKARSCVLCKLCKTRTNVVIERGSRNAPFMFVGEGPGEDEDLQGLPFVGRSGQLLDKMIAAMGLNKESDVYICNIVKCRPPSNRNPEEEEIAACNHYLRSQIAMVKPKIILTLGRFASQTLLNSKIATTKLRKKVHQYNTIPVVVTYHPAYLLRNPSAKKDAWDDLQLALSIYAK
ncbi:MAG: uracil-DNA glycosylase [Burkholderiales bacterium]|nr:uracil-DNA glycosylase [Burkholderiales bacterium]